VDIPAQPTAIKIQYQRALFLHSLINPKNNKMNNRTKTPFLHDHSILIGKLTACAMICEYCENGCLNESDVTMMARCIELDRDCADICLLTARLLQRESEISHEFLAICEKACRLCALECSKHDNDHCRKCTEFCQECADACHHHGIGTSVSL
jgi:hypothetical protein